jgi:hypothetical protein
LGPNQTVPNRAIWHDYLLTRNMTKFHFVVFKLQKDLHSLDRCMALRMAFQAMGKTLRGEIRHCIFFFNWWWFSNQSFVFFYPW